MSKFLKIFVGLLVFSTSVFAQDTLWTKTYGGTDYDGGRSVQECASGEFIIAGATESYGAGLEDVYLIRTDAQGDTLWTKTYGGTNDDWGYSVQGCSSGGFIIAGSTTDSSGYYDVYLIRTNANGDTLWTKTYGGTSTDEGYSVQEYSSGGFIVAGYTNSYGAGSGDVYLIRTNANGDTLWTKTYGGTSTDEGYSVQECSSGGFIIAGWTNSLGAGNYDVYLIRTDAQGDTLWTRTYGGADDDRSYSVQECKTGGFIIAGYTEGAGYTDVYLIRTNANGDTLWTKTYGGANNDGGYSVQECSSGGFIIAGNTKSFGSGYFDVYLIRTDSLGDTLWTRTYGGTDYDGGSSVQECASGGFIIAGYTTDSYGYYDIYLSRVSESGGIEEEYPQSKIQHSKLQSYPNPVFESAMIRYGVPVKSTVSLRIYDLTGRLVKTLVDGEKEAGYYTVRWDASGIKSGVYFIKFKTDNYEATRKIVLMK